jgi:hypothetical protein
MHNIFCLLFALAILTSAPSFAFFGHESDPAPVAHLNVIQDGADMYRILSGSTIELVLDTPLSTETATVGDGVRAHLAKSLDYNGQPLLLEGTIVTGKVSAVDTPKKQLKADVSTHHWLNAQAGLDIDFNEIKTVSGSVLSLHAMPAPDTEVEKADPRAAKLHVDKNGDITPEYHGGRNTALGLAIDGAAIATGPFGLLLAPAAGAIAGATDPSYGLDRQASSNDAHPRWHGMLMGALGGVPGGFLAKDAIDRGGDVVLSPGDKVFVQLNADLPMRTR